MTLRIKTMLILIFTVVVAVGGSGLMFLQHFEEDFRNSIYANIDLLAKNRARSIAAHLRLQQLVATHIGDLIPRQALEWKDYIWLESYLVNHGQDFKMFSNGFFFLDESGILRSDYPAHKNLRGKDFSFRRYFQQTLAEKQGLIAQPYRSARTGKAVLTITAYLKSEEGSPLGILGCSANLFEDPEFSRIRSEKIGTSGYSYIFDKSRLMILHPEPERILARDVPIGANKMFDAAIAGFEGATETVNSKGVPMLAAFYGIEGTDWIVAVQQPVAEAMAPFQDAKMRLLIIIAVSSLVAALIGLVLVHRSMADLLVLEEITADLAIPQAGTKEIDAVLESETDKLKVLGGHAEFGPLANTIKELYARLGFSLHETNAIAEELDQAYQQLKSTQSQVLQQEKMASVGQLAAGVAHEINNPIGFVTSNLSALGRYFEKLSLCIGSLEERFTEKNMTEPLAELKALEKKYRIDFMIKDVPDLLKESADGLARVKDIVQNLKNFSRVDQSEFTQVNINDCLDSTIKIASNEIKSKAEIRKEFAELPLLNCFAQELNQVFLNILLNATQAITESGLIRVQTQLEDNVIKVVISDNGCGIAPENLSRIFEPFFTTKEVGQGTGLGMSIAYEIVQNHGGNISVESELGQGTRFTIELPLGQEEDNNG